MNRLEQSLLSILQPWRQAPGWLLAFSGGLDSTVLLHLLAGLRRHHVLPPLRALHVSHGLQAVAAQWPEHCAAVCAQLGVPFRSVAVQVAEGASIEQAARQARYAALAAELAPGEVLLTAQHGDDQVETVLFRLLRGAGVRGLAGMPVQRAFAGGHLLRPLLGCTRGELECYAREHQLRWVDDPSNADTRLSRNHLRHAVLPPLREHWPALDANLQRSARQLREADELLGELAEQDLAPARVAFELPWRTLPSLLLGPLRDLSEARQRNALRHFLAPLTLLPDERHWAGWCSLRDAQAGAQPIWRLHGGELHRSDERLWWLSGDWLRAPAAGVSWESPQSVLVLPGNGRLRWSGEAPVGPLRVTYRRGGESLVHPLRGRRDLKRLLNEARIPVFVRDRLPLVYAGAELLAVAALPGYDRVSGEGAQLLWEPPTSDVGLSW
ncbi:tRNA lysidine(34) synthetase TilS [Pseudomonas sp. HAR-UPW-AIA-41]|uniref:tRNA lysidine(34) synthetase TilS n=1 Tax=Pseudomonas sp. HAR-UPW-AIA-41 TaxID=1985301 RepID=UPI000BB3066A|nr:tRNA lysidine(34) synthetase TilS [Pseudomonas sp. HAR-UPW-AIA-41]PAV49046.1 tRNA lysidine(34) synthetase TilS [Pseudomonas sp. HAR-UPW-AIA-41]